MQKDVAYFLSGKRFRRMNCDTREPGFKKSDLKVADDFIYIDRLPHATVHRDIVELRFHNININSIPQLTL